MTVRVILTVLGPDRPGLTRSLADAVAESGGNWLESQLARLGGQYVGAVLVELDPSRLAQLEQALRAIASSGLRVDIVPAGEAPGEGGAEIMVEVIGQDRPGIVREVTTALAATGANIEEFSSSRENTAWSGGLLFRAELHLSLPEGTPVDHVREALEAISGEIMVDLTMRKRGQGKDAAPRL